MARRLTQTPRWSPQEIERLRSMASAGLTMSDAASELGRALCAVKCKAMREGICFPRKGWRPRDEMTKAIIGSAMLRDAILRLAA